MWKKGLCMVLMHGTACLQDMGMGGQVYDRQQIEQMYGKGGENFPGQLPANPAQHAQYCLWCEWARL